MQISLPLVVRHNIACFVAFCTGSGVESRHPLPHLSVLLKGTARFLRAAQQASQDACGSQQEGACRSWVRVPQVCSQQGHTSRKCHQVLGPLSVPSPCSHRCCCHPQSTSIWLSPSGGGIPRQIGIVGQPASDEVPSCPAPSLCVLALSTSLCVVLCRSSSLPPVSPGVDEPEGLYGQDKECLGHLEYKPSLSLCPLSCHFGLFIGTVREKRNRSNGLSHFRVHAPQPTTT